MIFIYAIIASVIGFAGSLFLVYSDNIVDFTDKVFNKIFGSYDSKNKKNSQSANTPVEGSPLAGSSLTKDMKQAIEPLLLSWENADSSYLTGRMDTTFRQMQENNLCFSLICENVQDLESGIPVGCVQSPVGSMLKLREISHMV